VLRALCVEGAVLCVEGAVQVQELEQNSTQQQLPSSISQQLGAKFALSEQRREREHNSLCSELELRHRQCEQRREQEHAALAHELHAKHEALVNVLVKQQQQMCARYQALEDKLVQQNEDREAAHSAEIQQLKKAVLAMRLKCRYTSGLHSGLHSTVGCSSSRGSPEAGSWVEPRSPLVTLVHKNALFDGISD